MNKTISQNRLLILLSILVIGIIVGTGILVAVDSSSIFLGLSLLAFVTVLTIFQFNLWLEWAALAVSVLVYGYAQYFFYGNVLSILFPMAIYIPALILVYIPARIIHKEIFFTIKQYASNNQLINQLTLHDSLGLIKWKFFLKSLNDEFVRSRRSDTPVSIMMIRIANYHEFVSEGKKTQAEELLGKSVQVSQKILRTIDIVSRSNPETLGVVLPETSEQEAKIAASRVINGLAKEASLAVHIGIASFPNDGVVVEKIISRAEAALEYAVSSEEEQVSYSQLNINE